MFDLRPGDVLSYSAGSTQTGPEGFRKVQPEKIGMLGAAGEFWPEIAEAFAGKTILYVNAYPATLGRFTAGVSIDTYLSPRVLTRALKLAHVAGHPVIMTAQPLFLVDALMRHLAAGHPLPATIMFQVGGYVFPRTLEKMLRELLTPHVERFFIVQYFGAAEVDAGVMAARERDAAGELIYRPRPDVLVEVDGEDLLLSLRGPGGERLAEPFRTGDCARAVEGGWTIRNPKRLHPDVHAALESWTSDDWKRRTGYVRREDKNLRIQLRAGETPETDGEYEHFEFARRFGFSWLEKPYWR